MRMCGSIFVVCLLISTIVFVIQGPTKDIPFKLDLSVEPRQLVVRVEDADQPLVFRIHNRGTAPVRIVDVETTCGCTVVTGVAGRFLQPNETVEVRVQVSPPTIGEKTSRLTIHTIPAQSSPTVVSVTLKGKDLVPPYIAYCPDVVSLSGTTTSSEVVTGFEVHTVEQIASPLLLVREQYKDSDLQIWFDSEPREEPLFGSVRRIYNLKAAGRLPQSYEQIKKHRHTFTTTTECSQPKKSVSIESHVVPLVRVVPSVVNLVVPQDSSSILERTIVLIDSRAVAERIGFEPKSDKEWVRVESAEVENQEERSLHTFKIVVDPRNLVHDADRSAFRSQVTFSSSHEDSTTVSVSIILKTQE